VANRVDLKRGDHGGEKPVHLRSEFLMVDSRY
jgi:hypothetical protein